MKAWTVIRRCAAFWRSFVVLVLPLALLPLVFVPKEPSSTSSSRCAYVALLMAFSWMMELMPLAVTSLLPVALFPLLGIASTGEVCMEYLNKTCMLFIGGKLIFLLLPIECI